MNISAWIYKKRLAGWRVGTTWAVNQEISPAPRLEIWHRHRGTGWEAANNSRWKDGDWSCARCHKDAPDRMQQVIEFLMLGHSKK